MSDALDQGLRACVKAAREDGQDVLAAEARRRAAAHGDLNAFIGLDTRTRARAAGAAPLSGVPFAQKDNFCTAGLRTTCASRMLGASCRRTNRRSASA